MKSIRKTAIWVRETLNSPAQVFIFCGLFFVLTLSLNGVPLRLWGLHRDFDRLEGEIQKNLSDIKALDVKLSQAQEPAFIERQARDRLDLASENDLIFVFPTQ